MKKAILLLAYTVICFFVWRSYDYTSIGVDDANIYFTYAKNLANGFGFVYNAGGEHVEGFTSLLWTVICSGFYIVFKPGFELPLLIFNFLITGTTILVCSRIMDRLGFRFRHQLLWTILVCITPGFLDWCVISLLETGFWCLLLSVTILQLLRLVQSDAVNSWLFGLLLALLIVTRPESFLWSLLLLLIFAALNYRASCKVGTALKQCLAPMLLFALSMGGLLLFRRNYFGFPFPNTYYAKVSAEPVKNLVNGIRYLLKFCVQFVTLVLPFFLGLYLTLRFTLKTVRAGRRLSDTDVAQLLLMALAFVNLFIPIASGGDHFGLARFYQPLLPVMLLPLLHNRFWNEHSGNIFDPYDAFSPILLGIGICLLYWMPLNWILGKNDNQFYQLRKQHSILHYDFLLARENRVVATKLNNFFKASPVIGVIATGGFGYAYNGKTIDLMGLNNVEMAHADKIKRGGIKNHNAFNKAVFFRQKPDMIAGFAFLTDTLRLFPFMLDKNFRGGFENTVMKGLYVDQDFLKKYDFVLVSDHHAHYLVTWMNREFEERLKHDANFEIKPQGVTLEN